MTIWNISWQENELMLIHYQSQYDKHYLLYMRQRRQPFLQAFDKYIYDYIEWSWKELFSLEFIHAEATKWKKLIDLSGYNNINERYKHPSRLFSSWWSYVEYMDYEQFIHDFVDWGYTLRKIPITSSIKLKKIFVPKVFIKKNKQDTIFYI